MALKTIALAAALLMVAAVALPAVPERVDNVIVSGTVPCSSVAINIITPTTPVFANATVVLLCGQDTVGITVSNRNGAFSLLIAANVTRILFPEPLGECRLVVRTSLRACNPLLPSNGTLQAALQLQASVNLSGIFGSVPNLGPSIFQYREP